MRLAALLVVAGGLAVFSSAALAIDYGQIDRALTAEPEYRADMPQYALLLFGPRAELRVWVVLDRDTLYVDRNGDGDLTAAEDRVGELGDCRDLALGNAAIAGEPTSYVIRSVSSFDQNGASGPERFLLFHVEVFGPVQYQQYGGVALKDSPTGSHLAHFDGPLRIYPGSNDGRPGPEHVLRIGTDPIELDVVIGTIDADHGCWVAVQVERSKKCVLPEGVFPWVDIEFPARVRGNPPVHSSYPLSGFC